MAGPRDGSFKPSESRRFTPEEAEECAARLRKRIVEVQNPELKSARYDDARVVTVENAIRATVADIFGSTSTEGQRWAGFRFTRQRIAGRSSFLHGTSNSREIAADMQEQLVENLPRTAAVLQGLIDLIGERTVSASAGKVSPLARVRTGRVFVVHGHNDGIKQDVARTLDRLGFAPVILHEQPDGGRTIIEKLEEHADDVDFAIVLMTGDDVGGRDAENLRPRARQNVVLELGMFVGKLGRRGVRVLYETGVEMPSDYLGVLYIPLDAAGAWRFKLVNEMKAAGLDVDANDLLGQ